MTASQVKTKPISLRDLRWPRVRGYPSLPSPLAPHGELLYLISRGGRTLIKRPAINNAESRARVAPTPLPAFPSARKESRRGPPSQYSLVKQFS